MGNDKETDPEKGIGEEDILNRRAFLEGLGKWSKIVVGAAIFGGALLSADQEANGWINRAGGWVNRGGGGGAGWVNRGGGSAAWANRGAGWANRGGSWVNRY